MSLTPEGRQQIADLPVAKLVGLECVENAFMTLIAWRRAMPRYPAHLYLAWHLHAARFAALALMSIVTMFVTSIPLITVAGFATLAYILWYGSMAARRVFAESWGRTIAKAAAVGVAYGVVLSAVTTIIFGYVIIFS